MNLRDGYQAVMEAVAAAWAVPAKLTVSQWADQHRVLPAKAAAEPGPWRTSRNPLLREPMDALSDHHPAVEVSLMVASQFGKSEVVNNWVGYSIHHAPAPMLLVEPTVETMERYSKQRIEPMIAASDALRARVPSARSRDSGNTTLLKEFPGGLLVMSGANSSSGLASMPIKKLALDELDRYPQALGAEGSTIKQAEQRTVTFARSKQLNVSTPVRMPVDDDDLAGSQIWRKYQAGSRAKYFVPCPHCGHHQALAFEHLRWEKDTDERGLKRHRTDTAVYMCQAQGCGLAIEEHHKPAMLADGAMGGTAHWVHERAWLKDERPSYWASALYTPIGLGRSWKEIADEWLEACRDRSKLVTFWNLVLGLPFDDHADRVSEQDLEQHAENYPLRTIPRGYYVLTGSVDTQKDRLEFLVRAWGPSERSIVIDRVRLYGDPERDEVWHELTRVRHQTFANACGVSLRIGMTAIDTGGASTQRVYRYCREHRHDNVMAVKGASLRKLPVLTKPSRKDVKNSKGEVAKHGVALWMVGTDTAKQALFARLADWSEQPDPAHRMVRLTKALGPDFFRELTAEVFDNHSGLWKQIRVRNEALDLMVYSHAAACHPSLRVDKLTTADWAHYARLLEPATGDLFDQADKPAPADPADPSALAPPVAPTPQPDRRDEQLQPVEATAPAHAADAVHQTADEWLAGTDSWLD